MRKKHMGTVPAPTPEPIKPRARHITDVRPDDAAAYRIDECDPIGAIRRAFLGETYGKLLAQEVQHVPGEARVIVDVQRAANIAEAALNEAVKRGWLP